MVAVFSTGGAATALLLAAALLAAGARADLVTTDRCKEDGRWHRLRLDEVDSRADRLDISNCGLTEMENIDFINLPELKIIYLYNNNLTDINQAALRLVPTVETLQLDFNKLRELPIFDGLSCPSLTWLYVGHNFLTAITDARTFSSCVKLSNLFLHHNQIEYLHPDIFSSLKELKSVTLSDNKITFIPDQMFISNRKLRILKIDGNRITYLPPEFASNLKRTGVGLFQFKFEDNPWQCACLLESLVDVKRAGVVDYYMGPPYPYSGGRPACVYAGAAPCCRHPPAGLLPPRRPPPTDARAWS